jgi:hypothetical protein
MRIPCTCLLVLLGLGAARAQTPNDYAARWPLQTRGHAPVWQFEAGGQLHAVLQDPDFGDLQVFDAAGAAMPTLRLASASTSAPQWLPARFASSGPAEGAAGDAGVMSYAYRLPALLAVDAVRIRLGTMAAPANVALQYRSGGTWTTAARLTATGSADDAGTAADEVRFPQAISAHEWRVRSGLVLAPAPTLQFAARPVRFAFLAKGAGPFTLAVGSPVLRRREPVGAESMQLRGGPGAAGQPPLATLGARAVAPFVAAVATVPGSAPWRSWLGGGLLLAAGMAVALLPGRRRQATA